MVSLDIYADPTCPWSYIAKGYLDLALHEFPEHPFEISWHPFLLNPTMPAAGMDRRQYLLQKFGNEKGVARAYAPLLAHAEKAQVPLNIGAPQRMPCTIDAQRLIHWATIEQRGIFAAQKIMDAYWRDGRDISDHQVLCDIGEEIELERPLVSRLLASSTDTGEILERDAAARHMGVSASPTFIVASHHVIAGAQPTQLWRDVICDLTPDGQSQ